MGRLTRNSVVGKELGILLDVVDNHEVVGTIRVLPSNHQGIREPSPSEPAPPKDLGDLHHVRGKTEPLRGIRNHGPGLHAFRSSLDSELEDVAGSHDEVGPRIGIEARVSRCRLQLKDHSITKKGHGRIRHRLRFGFGTERDRESDLDLSHGLARVEKRTNHQKFLFLDVERIVLATERDHAAKYND